MNITPGLVGLNPPHVLWDPKVLDDLNIGLSKSYKLVFQIQKLKSCTVNNKSSKKGDLSNASIGL